MSLRTTLRTALTDPRNAPTSTEKLRDDVREACGAFISSIQASTIRFILVGVGLMLLVIYRPQGILGDKKELTFVK
jgi:ABC-type branched-subunit amino acid transport system permease subunit